MSQKDAVFAHEREREHAEGAVPKMNIKSFNSIKL